MKFIQDQCDDNLVALWQQHNDRFMWAVLGSIADPQDPGALEKIRAEAGGVIGAVMAVVDERKNILKGGNGLMGNAKEKLETIKNQVAELEEEVAKAETREEKTTAEHFETFQGECEYWLDKFSLREWEVTYEHKNSKYTKRARAWYLYDFKGRACSLGLAKDYGQLPTESDLCKSAFHEVSEILLAGIEALALIDIYPSAKEELEVCKHATIRRLEHAVWRPDYLRRSAPAGLPVIIKIPNQEKS